MSPSHSWKHNRDEETPFGPHPTLTQGGPSSQIFTALSLSLSDSTAPSIQFTGTGKLISSASTFFSIIEIDLSGPILANPSILPQVKLSKDGLDIGQPYRLL